MEYLQMLLLLMPGKKIFFSHFIRGHSGVNYQRIGRGSGGVRDRDQIGRGMGEWPETSGGECEPGPLLSPKVS